MYPSSFKMPSQSKWLMTETPSIWLGTIKIWAYQVDEQLGVHRPTLLALSLRQNSSHEGPMRNDLQPEQR